MSDTVRFAILIFGFNRVFIAVETSFPFIIYLNFTRPSKDFFTFKILPSVLKLDLLSREQNGVERESEIYNLQLH